jgi:hypothetical protein
MARYGSSGEMLPTGHVYGVVKTVQELAFQYRAVVLAVDSRAFSRYDALPGYKSGRHSVTGVPFDDYKIMGDLVSLLKICTFQKNVFYIKHDGMESDDIIASWIAASNSDTSKDLSCYFNDNDILQTKGLYTWYTGFSGPPMDRMGYIRDKYGMDLDFLPLWWKVVRGDKSDGIAPSLPRYPSKKLLSHCIGMAASGNDSVECLVSFIGGLSVEQCERVMVNYKVVRPIIVPVSSFGFKRLNASFDDVMGLLKFYEISDFVPVV